MVDASLRFTLDVLYKTQAPSTACLMQQAGAAKSGIPHHKAGVELSDMGPSQTEGGNIARVPFILYEYSVLSAIFTITALALRCLVLS